MWTVTALQRSGNTIPRFNSSYSSARAVFSRGQHKCHFIGLSSQKLKFHWIWSRLTRTLFFPTLKYFFSSKVGRVSFVNTQILHDVFNKTLGFVAGHDAQPLTWSLIGFQTCLRVWISVTQPLVWNPHLLWSFSLLIFVDNGQCAQVPWGTSGWHSRRPRLVIHLHVLIWIRFRSHALSRFNFFFPLLPRYKHVGF